MRACANWRAPALRLALLALLAGCAGEATVTEILACYSIEPAASGPSTVVRVCVETDDGARVLYGCDDGVLLRGPAPAGESQAFVQDVAHGLRLTLTADGVVSPDGSLRTVRQSAVVPFVPDRVVDLSLTVEAACAGLVCRVDETCAGGACVPVTVDAACLVPHGAAPHPSCGDPRLVRGCTIGE